MSALDQAFINAYQKGRAPSAGQVVTEAPAARPPIAPQGVTPHSQPKAPAQPAPQERETVEQAPHTFSTETGDSRLSYDPAGQRVPPPAMYRATPSATATGARSEPWQAAPDPVEPPVSQATLPPEFQQQTGVAPQSADAWRPVFEVERFAWPRVTEAMLQAAPEEFDAFTQHLLDGVNRGRWLVLLAGAGAEVGCTSTLLTVAHQLRGAGLRLGLVDLNRHRPALARRLGIQPPAAWPAVMEQGLPLEEVMIESLEDSLSVAPLNEPCDEQIERITTSGWRRFWQALNGHFDLVLADLGGLPEAAALGSVITDPAASEVVVVQDVRRGSDDIWPRVRKQLEQLGARHWSVAQNFTVQF